MPICLAKRLSLFIVLVSLLICNLSSAVRVKVFDAPMNGTVLFERDAESGIITSLIPKLIGVSSDNVVGEWYAEYVSSGDLLDLTGNGRTLSDTNSPTRTSSVILGDNNNVLPAFSYNGASQYHSRATESWMRIFDSDFSLSFLLKTPTTTSAIYTIFCHGSDASDGLWFYMDSSSRFTAILNNSAATPTRKSIVTTASYNDGNNHLIHIVRSSNYFHLYVDGNAVGTSDCTGYGVDGNRSFILGMYNTPGFYWPGQFSYVRFQNNALTFTQIQREVGLFQGFLGGAAAGYFDFPIFQRSTTAYASLKTGNASVAQIVANWANKTSEGANLTQPSATQLLTYTGAFSTNWSKYNSSIAATSVVLPDNTTGTTNTLKEDATAGVQHFMIQNSAVTSGATYTFSIYVKYNSSATLPREYLYITISDGTNSRGTYFNIQNGTIGSSLGALSGGANVQGWGNGWYRIWIYATAGATATGYVGVYLANTSGTTFDGLNQDSVYIAFPQFETGAFPTSYVSRLADTVASRSSDFYTFIPWQISKNLASKVNATPILLFKGTESLNAATVTPTTGSYTFTKNGAPQNGSSKVGGGYFSFNKNVATDYLSLADASGGSDFDFSAAGAKFSGVLIFTPKSVAVIAKGIVGKWEANKRQWLLYHYANDFTFAVSKDGVTTGTYISVTNNQIGKPVLITFSYDGTSGDGASAMALRVDNITAATSAVAVAPINNSDTYFGIGRQSATLVTYAVGQLGYLAIYNNYVISASEHAAMYTAFKQDGILPLTMSSTKPKKKLSIEFDAKCLFASSTDIGGNRNLFEISGAYGISSQIKNRVRIYVDSTGFLESGLYDSTGGTLRRMYSGVNNVAYNNWNNYKTTFDFSDLSNSTVTVNGTSEKDNVSNLTGAQEIKFHDALIRVGAMYDETVNSACEYRNLKIFTE